MLFIKHLSKQAQESVIKEVAPKGLTRHDPALVAPKGLTRHDPAENVAPNGLARHDSAGNVAPNGLARHDSAESKKTKLFTLFGLGKRPVRILLATVLTLVLSVAFFSFYLLPPSQFPTGKIITIKKGLSLFEVSLIFEKERLVRSRALFEFCTIISGGEKSVIAGEYLFKERISACAIATRVIKGIFGISVIKITIPEGTSNQGIIDIIVKSIPAFDINTKRSINEVRMHEGYLFPDTYFLPLTVTRSDVVEVMNSNFQKQIEPLMPGISASLRSLHDIIIMASILEKETKTKEDQSLVSGILWKRISLGMPLQVDATFYYLLGKTSSELTQADLKMESEYNTYKNKGLPVGPIGNPGINTIRAAIYPKESPYLYYLSDKQDVIHYAKNFEEHRANKAKYLR